MKRLTVVCLVGFFAVAQVVTAGFKTASIPLDGVTMSSARGGDYVV